VITPSLFDLAGRATFRYDILNPQKFFKNEDVCCSGWLLCGINDIEAEEAGEYFSTCKEALAKFGIPVKLEFSNQAKSYNLSPEGYARLVLGAAAGNMVQACEMFEALGAKATLSRRKIATARKLIRKYSDGVH